MMALINVIYRQVNKPSDNSFMKLYRQLKFKMKLAYEAWSREIAIGTLLHYAVLKTLQQKLCDTSRLLKQIIRDKRFNIQHRLLSASDESSEAVLKEPDQKRLKKQIQLMTYQMSTGFLHDYFIEENCKLEWRMARF